MFDELIQNQINKTIIDLKTKKIKKNIARNKFNKLIIETKNKGPKGKKRAIKNEIFNLKKSFKL